MSDSTPNGRFTGTLGGRYVQNNSMPISEASSRFGAIFKERRLAQNVTQKYLATHIGVSETVIKRLESGKPISTENMLKVMIALMMFKDFQEVFATPEISLKDKWALLQKKEKSK